MTKRFKLRKTMLALCVASTVSIVPGGTAANGLKSEMDAIFDGMSNTTPAGVYETQRRGVLSGGRYTTKTAIFNENLVSFTPPSFKGGCGGIDMFGGSLSFINAEQIVTLLRAVASNAKGYAFQLALDNVFPDGAKWIENFQKKIQALNQYLGNSCQLAQGIVNDTMGSVWEKGKTDASIKATGSGLYDDVFQSNEATDGPPKKKIKDHAPDEFEKLIGNIVWEQLSDNNAKDWFTYGDNTLLEAIMSLTGTVIIEDLDGGVNPDVTPVTTLPGNKIKLADLISGNNVEIYTCGTDTDNCLGAGKTGTGLKTVNITGIKDKIEALLLGSGSSVGAINKFATNSGGLSAGEKAFLANLPVGTGTIIRNLSVLSKDSAEIFAIEASGSISLSMIYSLANELFRAAFIAISNTDSPHKNQVIEILRESQAVMRSEYAALAAQYGDLSELIGKYTNILNTTRKQKYMMATLSKPPKSQD